MIPHLSLALALHVAAPTRDVVQVHVAPGVGDGLVEVARRLDEALERAVPLLERWTDRALGHDARLVLRLHPDLDAYRDATASLGLGRFRDAGAVTAWPSGEAHVALQPRGDAAYLEAVGGLPELTLALALHELVHQFVERSGAFPVEHQPLWYAEGMAEALASRALRTLRPEGAVLLADDAAALLVDARDAGTLLGLGELFADAFDAAGLERRLTAYAQSASVFAYLDDAANVLWAARLDAFERALERRERPAPGRRARWTRRELDRLLRGELGDLAALDEAWRATLAAPPTWRLARRSAEWHADRLVVASFPGAGPAVCRAPNELPTAGLELELEVLDAGARTAFLALDVGHDVARGVEVRLDAGGPLCVTDRRDADDVRELHVGTAPLPAVGTTVRLAVLADRDRLLVRVDDRPPVACTLPRPLSPTARFAVGTHDGAACFRIPARDLQRVR